MFIANPYTPKLGGGISLEESSVGSGVAFPPGLECVLEYNGLRLNTQWSADRYQVTNIDGLSDADIRDTRDVNSDEHGETAFAAYYGGRTIVISGTIKAYSIGKLRDMQRALRTAFVDISQERMLHFRTGDFNKDVMIYCKKLAPISGIEQQANSMPNRDFQISLRASDPRFLSYYPRLFEFFPTPVTDWVPAGTVVCNGNFEANPLIRFYGPMTNSNIYNNATNQTLRVLAIGGNDYLEFDLAKRTLRNSAGLNMWSQLGYVTDYLTLAPGLNYLEYAGDSPHVRILWHDSYM